MEKLGFLKPNVHFLLTAREGFTRQAVTPSLKFTSYSLLASSDQVANLDISLKNLALASYDQDIHHSPDAVPVAAAVAVAAAAHLVSYYQDIHLLLSQLPPPL